MDQVSRGTMCIPLDTMYLQVSKLRIGCQASSPLRWFACSAPDLGEWNPG